MILRGIVIGKLHNFISNKRQQQSKHKTFRMHFTHTISDKKIIIIIFDRDIFVFGFGEPPMVRAPRDIKCLCVI